MGQQYRQLKQNNQLGQNKRASRRFLLSQRPLLPSRRQRSKPRQQTSLPSNSNKSKPQSQSTLSSTRTNPFLMPAQVPARLIGMAKINRRNVNIYEIDDVAGRKQYYMKTSRLPPESPLPNNLIMNVTEPNVTKLFHDHTNKSIKRFTWTNNGVTPQYISILKPPVFHLTPNQLNILKNTRNPSIYRQHVKQLQSLKKLIDNPPKHYNT